MPEEDQQALAAARLYSDNKTFDQIGEELHVSKSHSQTLVRRGIVLALNELEKSSPRELPETPPVALQDSEEPNPAHSEVSSFPFPQNPEVYVVQTSGIPRRVILMAKSVMIYDIFSSCGFEGDLSDFIEDSIDFMYQSRKPSERGNYG